MPRVTLSGYYGFGNVGDEAVLAGLIRALRDVRPDWQITALSGSPAATEAAHGIGAAHRYRPAALLKTISRTDLFLSGGGSLLQDVTSAHSVFYYLGVVRMAQMLGKRTMFIAQGIGPLIRPRTRKLVAAVANRLDAITVRDEGSAELLRSIGVTRSVEVTADPALLLGPERPLPAADDAWAAVSLRPWPSMAADFPAELARRTRRTLHDVRLMALPMHPPHDTRASEDFAAAWKSASGQAATVVPMTRPGTGIVPLETPLENLAACRLVIGMRLHALILAAACGVPAVALAYDPKVSAFMTQSGQGDMVYDLARHDLTALEGLLARAWAERESRAANLQSLLPALRAAARRNAEIASGLLG